MRSRAHDSVDATQPGEGGGSREMTETLLTSEKGGKQHQRP
jgi:hypothetical protein